MRRLNTELSLEVVQQTPGSSNQKQGFCLILQNVATDSESGPTLGLSQMSPSWLRQGTRVEYLSRNDAPSEHSSIARSLSTDTRVIKSETGSLLDFCKTWPPTWESELTLGLSQMWPSWLRQGTRDQHLSRNDAPSEHSSLARSLSTDTRVIKSETGSLLDFCKTWPQTRNQGLRSGSAKCGRHG